MSSWRKAAKNYREATEEFKNERTEEELKNAARDLEAFLMSADGGAALKLLKASKQFIRLGEEMPEGGYTTVYLLNENGLQRSDEAAGMWTAYSNHVPKPRLTSLSCYDAVKAAISPDRGRMKPSDVLDWLRAELDRIAEAAPKK